MFNAQCQMKDYKSKQYARGVLNLKERDMFKTKKSRCLFRDL